MKTRANIDFRINILMVINTAAPGPVCTRGAL